MIVELQSHTHHGGPAGASLVVQLILKHERQIRYFIRCRSGPQVLRRAALDDLFQQTATAAVTSADRFVFVDDTSFLAWVYTIARRVIAATLKLERRSPGLVRIKGGKSSGIGVSESALGGGGRTPSSLVAGKHEAVALREAIKKLPDHYRRVITLYKLEERPLDEVAANLGRTKGATCRLIARSIERLRAELVKP